MEEFAAVSKATEAGFLVVLTDVRLIIPAHGGTEMFRGSDGALSHHAGGGIAHGRILGLHVFLIIINSTIDLVILLASQLLLDFLAALKNGLCVFLLFCVQLVDSCRPHIFGPHRFRRARGLVDYAQTLILGLLLLFAAQITVGRLLFTTATSLLNHWIVGGPLFLWSHHWAALVATASAFPRVGVARWPLPAARIPFPPGLFEEERAHLVLRLFLRNLLRHLRLQSAETASSIYGMLGGAGYYVIRSYVTTEPLSVAGAKNVRARAPVSKGLRKRRPLSLVKCCCASCFAMNTKFPAQRIYNLVGKIR